MATSNYMHAMVGHLPFELLAPTAFLLTLLGILAAVRFFTTSRYHKDLTTFAALDGKTFEARPPPVIPYTFPFLAHSKAFLVPRPGEFWSKILRSHPRSIGACTVLLGGKGTHLLFSSVAVQSLFKSSATRRQGFKERVCEFGLGLDHEEVLKYYGTGEASENAGKAQIQKQERMLYEYLLEKTAVTELTTRFINVLAAEFSEYSDGEGMDNANWKEVGRLNIWLRNRLFRASTSAFMGSRITELCPKLCDKFFEFDRHLWTLFFRRPKMFNSKAHRAREIVLHDLMQWQEQMQRECGGNPESPRSEVAWEPIYGSRANRARQQYYAARGITLRSRAGMDLGFLFALSSNAIPSAGWMLMHILDPRGNPSLYERVMTELKTTERIDGSVDVEVLIALPLLQSLFYEVLRLYVDVLVSRDLEEDLTLPLDDTGRQVFLGKSTTVMTPTWLSHRNDALWRDPPCNQFYAERFLVADPVTGKPKFSTTGTAGKLFPFGGGKTMCPGRIFTKQEVLASVAMVLLKYDIEVIGFVDEHGRDTAEFPGLRQTYSGSGVMATDADMKVKIRPRNRSKLG